MKIGYYVQGDADEAVIWGLKQRWCPSAKLAQGKFRGTSGESFRREISKSLRDLKDKGCDILVVLTDADANLRWRDVKKRESAKIPTDYEHLTLFGVADRNIECWLAIDRGALARELECSVEDIPSDDPSHFVKQRFGLKNRDKKQDAKARVRDYVVRASLRSWLAGSDSFQDFYDDARRLAKKISVQFPMNGRTTKNKCSIPNEWENR